ncbi:copper amine oxidase-like protein [Paenibacillus methanolicus]|uniref:Copper amine oxidase-like protein n=2 Tax=Paenibacillus methanolicus TaxID=582686 RepID=A0A5S5C5D7_9BACL|nr:copper amine oxidase-like protein [Paenibacillus methanolicus]
MIAMQLNGETIDASEVPVVLGAGNRLHVPISLFNHNQIQAQYNYYVYKGEAQIGVYNDLAGIDMILGQSIYFYYSWDDEGKQVDLQNVVPYLDHNQIMVPLRFVAEILGIHVKWEASSSTVSLVTDVEFKSELLPADEWDAWMAEAPLPADDPDGEPIRAEEIDAYIAQNDLSIVDYTIVSKYAAVALDVSKEKAAMYRIQRQKNGGITQADSYISHEQDEEGLSVSGLGDYIGVGIHEAATEHAIESVLVIYFGREGKIGSTEYETEGRKGFLIPWHKDATSAIVNFYGKDGFIHDIQIY